MTSRKISPAMRHGDSQVEARRREKRRKTEEAEIVGFRVPKNSIAKFIVYTQSKYSGPMVVKLGRLETILDPCLNACVILLSNLTYPQRAVSLMTATI